MLVFLDLETSGLDPELHHVLEVAAVITDDAFVEIARFERVVYWNQSGEMLKPELEGRIAAVTWWHVDPFVLDMHTQNGLWHASAYAPPQSGAYYVDKALAEFIRAHCAETGEKSGPQLAGNTISFDRAFLAGHFPLAHSLLHYRNLDVTTLNEMARRFWPAVHAARPAPGKAHRAMADCLESLQTARYYRDALGPSLTDLESLRRIAGTDAVKTPIRGPGDPGYRACVPVAALPDDHNFDRGVTEPHPWSCPASSNECMLRRACTNKCGQLDTIAKGGDL